MDWELKLLVQKANLDFKLGICCKTNCQYSNWQVYFELIVEVKSCGVELNWKFVINYGMTVTINKIIRDFSSLQEISGVV